MKRQELEQLQHKSVEELSQDMASGRKDLVEIRLYSRAGQGVNVHQARQLRKKLAQLEALIHAKRAQ